MHKRNWGGQARAKGRGKRAVGKPDKARPTPAIPGKAVVVVALPRRRFPPYPLPTLRLRLSLSFNAPLTPWWLREMPSVFLMPRLDRRKFTGGEERLRRRRSAEGLAVAGDRRFSLVAQERKCWIERQFAPKCSSVYSGTLAQKTKPIQIGLYKIK